MLERWQGCVDQLKLEYTDRNLEMKPYKGMKGTKDTEAEPFSPASIAKRDSSGADPAC